MIKLGDQVVVHGIMPPAVVKKIWTDHDSCRVVIELDWGDKGSSRVYAHDQNKIWYKYSDMN